MPKGPSNDQWTSLSGASVVAAGGGRPRGRAEKRARAAKGRRRAAAMRLRSIGRQPFFSGAADAPAGAPAGCDSTGVKRESGTGSGVSHSPRNGVMTRK